MQRKVGLDKVFYRGARPLSAVFIQGLQSYMAQSLRQVELAYTYRALNEIVLTSVV